ncbi:MAG: tetratricopeptide repeat protein [Chloracidobacterium sp.]|nr:tetratricopeptide repeat protein [Chloracidobacterium sp.]
MTKENLLFAVIGLLFGMMIGFFFANSVNQGALTPGATAIQPQPGMPSGHPSVPGSGGSVAEVQAAIDRAKADPNDFEAQMKAAELYYQIQRFDGAIEFLKNANNLQPENYEVIVNLGNANFDAGKYEEAEKWYTTALAKKPDNLDVRTDLGLSFVFREKPDNDRAIAEFKKVLDANPTHVQALQNMAVAYTKKKDAVKAEEALAKLEKADPSNATIAKLREDIAALK